MTRLLVVHPDPLVIMDRAIALEHAGYTVETCSGPTETPCPILDERACPLLDRADLLIYDAHLGSDQEMRVLVSRLRDTYADLPLIVLGGDETAPWAESTGPRRVWRMQSMGTLSDLTALIEEALSEQGMAV